MAKQSELERVSIQERLDELMPNVLHGGKHGSPSDDAYRPKEFTGDDKSEYSADNTNAIGNGDAYGKGTQTSMGVLGIPSTKLDYKNKQYGKTTETTKGGGDYDINGTQGIEGAFQGDAGRKYLTETSNLNLYSPLNEYGEGSVDTTINREQGQYIVK